MKNAAKAFWGIYLGLAGLEALLLAMAGLSIFDSLYGILKHFNGRLLTRVSSIAEYNST